MDNKCTIDPGGSSSSGVTSKGQQKPELRTVRDLLRKHVTRKKSVKRTIKYLQGSKWFTHISNTVEQNKYSTVPSELETSKEKRPYHDNSASSISSSRDRRSPSANPEYENTSGDPESNPDEGSSGVLLTSTPISSSMEANEMSLEDTMPQLRQHIDHSNNLSACVTVVKDLSNLVQPNEIITEQTTIQMSSENDVKKRRSLILTKAIEEKRNSVVELLQIDSKDYEQMAELAHEVICLPSSKPEPKEIILSSLYQVDQLTHIVNDVSLQNTDDKIISSTEKMLEKINFINENLANLLYSMMEHTKREQSLIDQLEKSQNLLSESLSKSNKNEYNSPNFEKSSNLLPHPVPSSHHLSAEDIICQVTSDSDYLNSRPESYISIGSEPSICLDEDLPQMTSDCDQYFVDAPLLPVPDITTEDEEDIYNVDNLPLPAPPCETSLHSVAAEEYEVDSDDDDTHTIAPSVVSSIGTTDSTDTDSTGTTIVGLAAKVL